jgi:hypothetical protein
MDATERRSADPEWVGDAGVIAHTGHSVRSQELAEGEVGHRLPGAVFLLFHHRDSFHTHSSRQHRTERLDIGRAQTVQPIARWRFAYREISNRMIDGSP